MTCTHPRNPLRPWLRRPLASLARPQRHCSLPPPICHPWPPAMGRVFAGNVFLLFWHFLLLYLHIPGKSVYINLFVDVGSFLLSQHSLYLCIQSRCCCFDRDGLQCVQDVHTVVACDYVSEHAWRRLLPSFPLFKRFAQYRRTKLVTATAPRSVATVCTPRPPVSTLHVSLQIRFSARMMERFGTRTSVSCGRNMASF